ncbi:uncharacterized protein LOC134928725 [Pseudophryne corroboree]|uniref:uncharacterized protein LOC134928725 n=1 Tax=Pseudophryne corroboree TaxID=495146 RepID=UPI0030815E69
MQIFLLVTLVAGVLRQSQCCNPNPKGINLARGGQATQSSLYDYRIKGYATNAIDGNRDGDFNKVSCTHTELEKNPWWNLDLRKSYKIGTIIVANRQECCADRLVGAEVRVGNSPNNNNPVCGVITRTGHITTLCCNGMEGRYVSVVIPGAHKFLHVCEVRNYGEVNLARNGLATQSSLYDIRIKGYPEKAIDGNKDGNFFHGACSHTSNETNPWWKLDLKTSYKINTIVVANRRDCCADRIVGAEVRVGNSPDNNNPDCGVITGTGPITTLCCNGMEGRYVSVVILGTQYLTLCEVEVYGHELESLPNHVCL